MQAHLYSSDSYSIQANSYSFTDHVEAISTIKNMEVFSSNNAVYTTGINWIQLRCAQHHISPEFLAIISTNTQPIADIAVAM